MLIEIHVLQNHAPSNLNRDDTGSPKECLFGGVKRARISSQCLKRTIRRSDSFREALADSGLATRTRRLPELVRARFIAAGLSPEFAAVAAKKASGFGTKEGKERPGATEGGALDTAQTMFLTEADIAAVTEVLKTAAEAAGSAAAFDKIAAKDLQARAQSTGFRPISVDVALFGRMTTSEAFRDVDGAIQVAHALSTHRVEAEFDYFTAVDDLQGMSEVEEDAGADMIGDVEFNSACYYKYVSLDVRDAAHSLTGEAFRASATDESRAEAAATVGKAARALLEALVMTTPTGKQNSFAAHQLPALVLVEMRPRRTPISYANAFVEPVRPFSKADGDLVTGSLEKMKTHVEALTKGFNLQSSARLLLAPLHPGFAIGDVTRVDDLQTLCAQVEEWARQGANPVPGAPSHG